MYTQLAYHANLARIDELKRQAADYRRATTATRTRRAFRFHPPNFRAAETQVTPAPTYTKVA